MNAETIWELTQEHNEGGPGDDREQRAAAIRARDERRIEEYELDQLAE